MNLRTPLVKAITRSAAPIGVIGAVGGFLSDVLLPLANFAPFIAAGAVLATVVLAVLLLRLDKKMLERDVWDTFPGALYMVAAGAAIIFSSWTVILAAGPERGYLAENVDPIAEIQASLLNLEEDVAEIKETTGETATQVAQAATAQAEGFASLEEALANIQAGSTTIIENPSTPQEWYNNAKIYQLKGDTANAIAAYEGYFASDNNLEFVDPYEDYVDLLNATQGIARARDILAGMRAENPDNLTVELMLVLLQDTVDQRIAQLEALTQKAPYYGPGFYYLGQELDRKLRETTTNALLEKQSTAYNTLFSLEETQGFSVYYVDKLAAGEKLEQARVSLEAYSQAAEVFGNVGLEVYNYAEGTQFIVIFPETDGQDAFYSIDDPEPAISLGKNTIAGNTYINQSIGPLNIPVGPHTFYFKYVDKNGEESEVYSFPFEVPAVIVIFTQNPPDFSSGIISGSFVFQVPYVETTANYTYKYSLDEPSLSESVTGIAVASVEIPEIEKGEHTLYVQAVSLDGTATDIVEFVFTVE